MSANRFQVGLVQMAMSADPARERRRGPPRGSTRRPAAAPRWSACRSCSAPPTSASGRTHALFDLAEDVPRPSSSRRFRRWRGRRGVAVVVPIFERRAPGLYHNSARASSTPTAACAGIYRKMHIPDDPAFYEKFYFTPGDLGFQAFDTRRRPHRHAHLLGPVVPRGARGSPRCRAPPSSSTRPPSAGTRPRRPQFGAAQRDAWQTIQRAHAIANGVLRGGGEPGRPRAPAGRAAPGSSSGASSFLCDPFGVVIAEASTDREEILVGEVDLAPHRGGPRATGPSCATGASTPTAASTAASSTERHGRHDARPRTASPCPPSGSRHEATWLAWPHNVGDWPGKLRAHPLGLRRDRRGSSRAGETVRLLVNDAAHEARARGASCGRVGATLGRGRVPPLPHRPRLDAATPAPSGSSAAAPRRPGPSPASASTPGPSTPTGSGTPASRRAPPGRSGLPLPAGATRGRDGGARGRRHRRERRAAPSSPPRSACSTPRSRCATPASAAPTTRQVFRDVLGRAATPSGWAGASPATTPTATSTTCARFVDAAHHRALPRGRTRRDANHAAARGEPRAAGRRRGSPTARAPRWSTCPCRRRSSSTASGCRPATPTSTSANAAVLVPTFNDPNDRVALGILGELFRDRPVVGIHAVDLVWGLGTLHCLTQQEPALPGA